MIDYDDQQWLDDGFEHNAPNASEECKAAVYAFFSKDDGVSRSAPAVHERDAGVVIVYERWGYQDVYMQNRIAIFDSEEGTLLSDGPVDSNDRWVLMQVSSDMKPPVVLHFDSKNEALIHIVSLAKSPSALAEMRDQLDKTGQYHKPSGDWYYLQQADCR